MKPTRRAIRVRALVVLLASGCVTVPSGPSVIVMPGSGKSFEQFQYDDAACRQWAQQQSGDAATSANQSTAAGAVIGTVIGAGLGAAIGAAAGNPGAGAAIGAGGGLLGGTAVGANAGAYSAATVQRRYDAAYQQCMYSKGHQIPGYRATVRVSGSRRCRAAAAPSTPAPATTATTTAPSSLAFRDRSAQRAASPP